MFLRIKKMKSFIFSKFSPAGNDTVFLHESCPDEECRSYYGAQALRAVGGEQAAFANTDSHTLTMAGGEFCANASRAFGALLDLYSKDGAPSRHYKASINEIDITLAVTGSSPQWHVTAGFVLKNITITPIDPSLTLVSLPGIDHLLLETGSLPASADVPGIACSIMKTNGLWDKNAAGVIWWQKKCGHMAIAPFVRASRAGTAMLESSCGSATLALAIAHKREVRAVQPSGDELSASWENGIASVGGPVSLVCRGRVWLPEKL